MLLGKPGKSKGFVTVSSDPIGVSYRPYKVHSVLILLYAFIYGYVLFVIERVMGSVSELPSSHLFFTLLRNVAV